MPAPPVRVAARGRVVLRRRLPHDPALAYAWLTDFDERDPGRAAGAVLAARRVVSRSPSRVVLEADLVVLGRALPATAEVDLGAPAHWRASLRDRMGRLVAEADYRLEPDGDGGSWLHVAYSFVLPKLRHRLLWPIAGPRLRRELARMWGGFAAAMDRELALHAVPVRA